MKNGNHRDSGPTHSVRGARRSIAALLALLALFATACVDGDSSEDAAGDTDEDASGTSGEDQVGVELVASARGVTADTITVGVTMIDFDFLVSSGLSPAGWGGNQQGVWEALIADLNERGGIHGRSVVPVFDAYQPTSAEDAARSCVAVTQDQEVFAVLGGFLGPLAGTEDVCIVGDAGTMLIGGEITADELDRARAPWFDTRGATFRSTGVLFDLLVESGQADGASVFVVSNIANQADAPIVVESLLDRGIAVADDAVLDANDADKPAQDAIMEVISEQIRTSGANTVMINGNPSAALRGLISSGVIADVAVWTNDQAGLDNLGADVDREQVRGVLTFQGPSDAELWANEEFQACAAIVQAAIPEAELVDPTTLTVDQENWFNPTWRYCSLLSMFEQLTVAAGPDLTYGAIVEASDGDDFDDFSVPGYGHMSIGPDKPDAQDEYRLGQFDPAAGDGKTTPLGELVDVFP